MVEIAAALGDSLRVAEETYIGLSAASKNTISAI